MSKTNWTVVICENGSGDNSESTLRDDLKLRGNEKELLAYSQGVKAYSYGETEAGSSRYILVISDTNRGFAGGNNLGYSIATTDHSFPYVWFLNNDTEVEQDTLSQMISHMQQDTKIGICGSTLIYAHDRKTVQALGGAIYQPWSGLVTEIGQGGLWPHSVDQATIESKLSYVSGASMLTSLSFLKSVGLMSEDYFLYYEEIDWAIRAKRADFRLGYVSNAVVYHKEGAALGSGKSTRRSLLAEYYGLRNKLVVTRKYFPWALPSVLLIAWLQVLKRLIHRQWSHARLMIEILLGLRQSPPLKR
jgi:hypothetical protein